LVSRTEIKSPEIAIFAQEEGRGLACIKPHFAMNNPALQFGFNRIEVRTKGGSTGFRGLNGSEYLVDGLHLAQHR
jgi:hypothetical protein